MAVIGVIGDWCGTLPGKLGAIAGAEIEIGSPLSAPKIGHQDCSPNDIALRPSSLAFMLRPCG